MFKRLSENKTEVCRPWVRAVAICVSAAFLFTILAAPFAEAGIWEERGRAVRSLKESDAPAVPQIARLPAALPEISGMSGGLDGAQNLPGLSHSSGLEQSRLEEQIRSCRERYSLDLKAVPSSYGEIRRIHLSQDRLSPFVVLIQDAHEVESAQRNIAALLDHFSRAAEQASGNAALPKVPAGQAGRTGNAAAPLLIGIEGARGEYELAKYRAFPDRTALALAADFMLRKGLINGAEFYGLTAEKEPLLWGVEDERLYLENVAGYRKGMKVSRDYKEAYDSLLSSYRNAAGALLTPSLKEMDALLEDYFSGRIGLSRYLRRLSARYEVKEGEFPQVFRFLESLRMEENLDFKRVERERNALLAQLSRDLGKDDLSRLLEASVAFRLGRIEAAAYYRHLKDLLASARIDLAAYPAFDAYVRYAIRSQGIEPARLFGETDALREKAVQSQAGTAEQKELFAVGAELRRIGKLSRFELGPEEWERYRAEKKGVSLLAGRIDALLGRAGGNAPSAGSKPRLAPALLPKLLENFEAFYSASDKRNSVLLENLLAKLDASSRNGAGPSAKVAVMITGGFHTPAIQKLLETKGLSYATISPRIGRVENATRYLEFFSEQRTPVEKMLLGERLFLAQHGGLVANAMEGFGYTVRMVKGMLDLLPARIAALRKGSQAARVTRETGRVMVVASEKGAFEAKVKEVLKEHGSVAAALTGIGLAAGGAAVYIGIYGVPPAVLTTLGNLLPALPTFARWLPAVLMPFLFFRQLRGTTPGSALGQAMGGLLLLPPIFLAKDSGPLFALLSGAVALLALISRRTPAANGHDLEGWVAARLQDEGLLTELNRKIDGGEIDIVVNGQFGIEVKGGDDMDGNIFRQLGRITDQGLSAVCFAPHFDDADIQKIRGKRHAAFNDLHSMIRFLKGGTSNGGYGAMGVWRRLGLTNPRWIGAAEGLVLAAGSILFTAFMPQAPPESFAGLAYSVAFAISFLFLAFYPIFLAGHFWSGVVQSNGKIIRWHGFFKWGDPDVYEYVSLEEALRESYRATDAALLKPGIVSIPLISIGMIAGLPWLAVVGAVAAPLIHGWLNRAPQEDAAKEKARPQRPAARMLLGAAVWLSIFVQLGWSDARWHVATVSRTLIHESHRGSYESAFKALGKMVARGEFKRYVWKSLATTHLEKAVAGALTEREIVAGLMKEIDGKKLEKPMAVMEKEMNLSAFEESITVLARVGSLPAGLRMGETAFVQEQDPKTGDPNGVVVHFNLPDGSMLRFKVFRAGGGIVERSEIPERYREYFEEGPNGALKMIKRPPLWDEDPERAARVWASRHGETDANVLWLFSGSGSFSGLTGNGKKQAADMAADLFKRLGGENWVQAVKRGERLPLVVLVSSKFRAQQTAMAITRLLDQEAEKAGLPKGTLYEWKVSQDLKEMEFGRWDNELMRDAEGKNKAFWDVWSLYHHGVDMLDRWPGFSADGEPGESRWDVVERQINFFESVRARYSGREVICLSHKVTTTAQKIIAGKQDLNERGELMATDVANAAAFELTDGKEVAVRYPVFRGSLLKVLRASLKPEAVYRSLNWFFLWRFLEWAFLTFSGAGLAQALIPPGTIIGSVSIPLVGTLMSPLLVVGALTLLVAGVALVNAWAESYFVRGRPGGDFLSRFRYHFVSLLPYLLPYLFFNPFLTPLLMYVSIAIRTHITLMRTPATRFRRFSAERYFAELDLALVGTRQIVLREQGTPVAQPDARANSAMESLRLVVRRALKKILPVKLRDVEGKEDLLDAAGNLRVVLVPRTPALDRLFKRSFDEVMIADPRNHTLYVDYDFFFFTVMGGSFENSRVAFPEVDPDSDLIMARMIGKAAKICQAAKGRISGGVLSAVHREAEFLVGEEILSERVFHEKVEDYHAAFRREQEELLSRNRPRLSQSVRSTVRKAAVFAYQRLFRRPAAGVYRYLLQSAVDEHILRAIAGNLENLVLEEGVAREVPEVYSKLREQSKTGIETLIGNQRRTALILFWAMVIFGSVLVTSWGHFLIYLPFLLGALFLAASAWSTLGQLGKIRLLLILGGLFERPGNEPVSDLHTLAASFFNRTGIDRLIHVLRDFQQGQAHKDEFRHYAVSHRYLVEEMYHGMKDLARFREVMAAALWEQSKLSPKGPMSIEEARRKCERGVEIRHGRWAGGVTYDIHMHDDTIPVELVVEVIRDMLGTAKKGAFCKHLVELLEPARTALHEPRLERLIERLKQPQNLADGTFLKGVREELLAIRYYSQPDAPAVHRLALETAAAEIGGLLRLGYAEPDVVTFKVAGRTDWYANYFRIWNGKAMGKDLQEDIEREVNARVHLARRAVPRRRVGEVNPVRLFRKNFREVSGLVSTLIDEGEFDDTEAGLMEAYSFAHRILAAGGEEEILSEALYQAVNPHKPSQKSHVHPGRQIYDCDLGDILAEAQHILERLQGMPLAAEPAFYGRLRGAVEKLEAALRSRSGDSPIRIRDHDLGRALLKMLTLIAKPNLHNHLTGSVRPDFLLLAMLKSPRARANFVEAMVMNGVEAFRDPGRKQSLAARVGDDFLAANFLKAYAAGGEFKKACDRAAEEARKRGAEELADGAPSLLEYLETDELKALKQAMVPFYVEKAGMFRQALGLEEASYERLKEHASSLSLDELRGFRIGDVPGADPNEWGTAVERMREKVEYRLEPAVERIDLLGLFYAMEPAYCVLRSEISEEAIEAFTQDLVFRLWRDDGNAAVEIMTSGSTKTSNPDGREMTHAQMVEEQSRKLGATLRGLIGAETEAKAAREGEEQKFDLPALAANLQVLLMKEWYRNMTPADARSVEAEARRQLAGIRGSKENRVYARRIVKWMYRIFREETALAGSPVRAGAAPAERLRKLAGPIGAEELADAELRERLRISFETDQELKGKNLLAAVETIAREEPFEATDELVSLLEAAYLRLSTLAEVQRRVDLQVDALIELKEGWLGLHGGDKKNREFADRFTTIGTAGDETGFVSWTHARALLKASRAEHEGRKLFVITTHAGEEVSDPFESLERVRAALDSGVSRIDHATILFMPPERLPGLRKLGDIERFRREQIELTNRVVEKGIVITKTPISNRMISIAVPQYNETQLHFMIKTGLLFTLAPDNREILGPLPGYEEDYLLSDTSPFLFEAWQEHPNIQWGEILAVNENGLKAFGNQELLAAALAVRDAPSVPGKPAQPADRRDAASMPDKGGAARLLSAVLEFPFVLFFFSPRAMQGLNRLYGGWWARKLGEDDFTNFRERAREDVERWRRSGGIVGRLAVLPGVKWFLAQAVESGYIFAGSHKGRSAAEAARLRRTYGIFLALAAPVFAFSFAFSFGLGWAILGLPVLSSAVIVGMAGGLALPHAFWNIAAPSSVPRRLNVEARTAWSAIPAEEVSPAARSVWDRLQNNLSFAAAMALFAAPENGGTAAGVSVGEMRAFADLLENYSVSRLDAKAQAQFSRQYRRLLAATARLSADIVQEKADGKLDSAAGFNYRSMQAAILAGEWERGFGGAGLIFSALIGREMETLRDSSRPAPPESEAMRSRFAAWKNGVKNCDPAPASECKIQILKSRGEELSPDVLLQAVRDWREMNEARQDGAPYRPLYILSDAGVAEIQRMLAGLKGPLEDDARAVSEFSRALREEWVVGTGALADADAQSGGRIVLKEFLRKIAGVSEREIAGLRLMISGDPDQFDRSGLEALMLSFRIWLGSVSFVAPLNQIGDLLKEIKLIEQQA